MCEEWECCAGCNNVIEIDYDFSTEGCRFWCEECFTTRPQCGMNECENPGVYKVHQEGWFCEECIPRCQTCQGPSTDGDHCEVCLNNEANCDAAEKAGVDISDDDAYSAFLSERAEKGPGVSLYEERCKKTFLAVMSARINIPIERARAVSGEYPRGF